MFVVYPRETIGHQIYSVIFVLPRDAARIARTILLQDFLPIGCCISEKVQDNATVTNPNSLSPEVVYVCPCIHVTCMCNCNELIVDLK